MKYHGSLSPCTSRNGALCGSWWEERRGTGDILSEWGSNRHLHKTSSWTWKYLSASLPPSYLRCLQIPSLRWRGTTARLCRQHSRCRATWGNSHGPWPRRRCCCLWMVLRPQASSRSALTFLPHSITLYGSVTTVPASPLHSYYNIPLM